MKRHISHARAAASTMPSGGGDRLNRALTRVSGATLREGNALALLRDGPATYEDWLGAIRSAQRWVHLENYIFKDDAVGHVFAEALIERAAAGVSVRVLYDWFGSLDVSRSFWRRLRAGGVDVRVVNALGRDDIATIVQRDHRKFVAVDGTYASVGGVCIADPWLERSPVTGLPYRDTSVRVQGPAVADLEGAFAAVWRRNGTPLPAEECPALDSIAVAGDMAARVIVQEPERLRMSRVLQVVLAGANERVWISDAYFLASPILREALMAAASDGVDVRILLPATNDLPVVGVLSRYGYRPLLEAGVQIWEYAGLMMHAKTTVADGWWGRIGSTNLNFTGLITNWEIDLVAEDKRFGAQLEAMYLDDLEDAREIRLQNTKRKSEPRPVRPESQAEKVARRKRPNLDTQAGATVARVRAGIRAASDATLQRNERFVGVTVSASLVSVALVGARFPRFLAWPLSLVGGVLGGIGLVRALRQPTIREP